MLNDQNICYAMHVMLRTFCTVHLGLLRGNAGAACITIELKNTHDY